MRIVFEKKGIACAVQVESHDAALNRVPRRRIRKDKTCVPLMGDVSEHPIDHRRDAIAKTYQEKNVHQQPRPPRNQTR